MQKLLADVRGKEREALKFKEQFDTIARYCAVTTRELEQLLEELQIEPPDNPKQI